MRIAIEANVLTSRPPTGIARYIRHLALALDALNRPGGELIETEMLYRWPRFRYRKLIDESPTQRRTLRIGDLWPRQSRFDCVLCTFRKTLDWPGVARVATVFDLYQELGLGYQAEEGRRFLEERRRLLAAANRIVCISEATRKDLLRFYPDTSNRATVVHLGVEERFAPAAEQAMTTLKRKYSLDRPFMLFMGLNSPNKNLARLIKAYRASTMSREFDLVIAGPAGTVDGGGEQAVYGSWTGIRSIGFVDDLDLPVLYSAASAFLMPSLHEGFGLPILEAMRCGTPVLAGDQGASPEVASGYATLVDPRDVDAIAAGMERVVDTPIEVRLAARRYACTKTWSETAEQTLEQVRNAIRSHAGESGSADRACAS